MSRRFVVSQCEPADWRSSRQQWRFSDRWLPVAANGIQVGGVNLAIDGNDISKLETGIANPGGGFGGGFSLVARNSITRAVTGIGISGTPYGLPEASWYVGNLILDNTITGPAGPPNGIFLYINTGISIAGIDPQSNGAQMLMNVIEGNVVSGYHIGIGLVPYTSTSGNNCFAGIVDTVLADNLFTSDGSNNSVNPSIGLTTIFLQYMEPPENEDQEPYILFGSNDWQDFWDQMDPHA